MNSDTGFITFNAWDQTSGTAGTKVDVSVTGGSTAFSAGLEVAAITVNAVNDAPVNTAPSGQYTALNTSLVFSAGNGNQISISDVDAGSSSVQVSLAVVHGTLTLGGTAGLTFTGGANGSASLTVTGSMTAINTALNGMTYAPTTNYRGVDTLQIVTNDLGRSGSGGAQSDTDTVKLYVGAVVVTNTDGGAANGNTTSISALAASDGGDGISLREAIIATNNTAGTDYIYFGISGTGVHTIAPTSALPAITGQVIIDATTDDSFAANGNRPAIVLDGNDLADHGVVLSAGSGGSTVRGLVIRNFGLDGLNIETGSDNNVIQGNYLGAFTTDGTSAGAAFQNAQRGISVSGANNLIGGTAPGEGNLVGGNLQSGIRLDGASATGNVVSGNLIGVAIDGTTPVSNEAAGVVIDNGASGNLIGGTSTAASNVIAYSGRDGIRVINASSLGNAFLGNHLFANNDDGIDLGNDGLTANDAGDADAGANNLQNFPVLTSATTTGSQITIVGSLNSTANSYFRIEFYGSTVQDGTGYGEGQTYLGFVNVTTDAGGNASFSTVLTTSVASGIFISATATRSNATFNAFTDTSEFAQNVVATVAPVVTSTGSTLAYTENAAATAIDPGLTVSDADSTNLTGATVSISANYANGQDVLAFTNQLGITGSWNSTTGVLTLTGTATVANYQTALRSVTYVNTSDTPSTAARTVAFTVSDGTANSNTAPRTISVTAVNDAPTLSNGTLASINEDTINPSGQTVATIFSGQFTDVDTGASLAGIAVVDNSADAGTQGEWQYSTNGGANWYAIGAVTDGATALAVSSSTLIRFVPVADYNGTPPALTVRGLDNTYVAGFSSTAGSETRVNVNTTTNGGTTAIAATTANLSTSITAVNDAPVITIASLTLNEGQTVTLAPANFGITDPDDASFTYTVSAISGGCFQLSSAAGTPITTFTSADLAGNLVQFVDDGNEVAPAFSVTVNDGDVDSNTLAATITYDPVNDAPVLAAIEGAELGYTENAAATAITGTVTLSDVDSATLAFAWVRITGNYVNGEDVLSFTNTANITGSWDASAGTLLLIGSDTVANYQAALRAVKYSNSSDNPSTVARTASFTANDGAVNSNTVTRDITVTTVNDAPTATITPASYAATEQVALTLKNTGLSISDADAAAGSMTVTLSVTEGTLAVTAGGSGAVVSNSGTSSVTITGTMTQINNLLNIDATSTVSYTDGTDAPSASATLTLQVNDNGNTGGGSLSNSDTATITITAVNDVPSIVFGEGNKTYTENGQPMVIDGAVVVSDVDSTDFDTGTLTVDFIASGSNDDRLAIRHEGTDPGQIGVSGNSVSYGGTTIASFAGGDGINPLIITFNANATATSVQALTRNITFSNVSDTPDTTARLVRFLVTDGAGGGALVTKQINVTAVNDAPVAVDDTITATEDTLFTSTVSLIANDTDVDGPSKSAVAGTYTTTQGGTLVLAADGIYTCSPAANFTGTDTVNYTVTDGSLTDVGTLTITVTAVNDAPTTSAVTLTAMAEDGTRTITAAELLGNAADVENNTLTVSNLAISSGTLVDNGNDTWDFTPALNDDSSVSFTYTITDNGTTNGAADPKSVAGTATLDITPVNDAPVLAAIGNQTVNEGTTLTFTATATDADVPANTLTYSLSGAPTGATINATTGVFSWTPTEAQGPGSFSFDVIVSDGSGGTDSETITVTVSEVNVAPILAAIGNQTIAEGSPLTFTASATDADLPANTLTYSLSGTVPTGAAINATTGVFSWTPTEAQGPGSYSFDVIVSDGALTDVETITVTVSEVNVAPILAAIGNQTIAEGSPLTFTASATDADLPANTLTYSLSGTVPTGATINATTGVFSWTPTEAQGPGSYSFDVVVSDGAGGTDSETITVTVNEANIAPVLAVIGNQTIAEGSTLTFTAIATDADVPANTLTYSLDAASLAAGMTINASTGVFSWTPTESQDGIHAVTVTVTDNGTGTLSDSETITITVGDTNTAPVLAAIGNQSVNEGATLSFTATASDADLPSQTLTYSLDAASLALGMTINSSTGAFNWIPSEAQGGLTPSVTITVTDNGSGNLTDSETFTITVGDTNVAPVLAVIGNQSVNEGATLSFTATATDADLPGQTLTYSLDAASLALGMSINSSTGAFSWTPSEAQGGLTPSVTVTVTDNGTGLLTDSETFTITVGDTNLAPVLTAIGNQSVNEGATLSFTATATDADVPAQSLTYSLDVASIALGMSIDANSGIFSWTPSEAQGGLTPSVTITVTDNGSGNLTDSETLTVTVGDLNSAPVLAAIGNRSVNEGATLNFTATATDADVPARP